MCWLWFPPQPLYLRSSSERADPPMKPKPCKGCMEQWAGFPPPAASKRPTPYPGPRCATHHRKEQKRIKKATHERMAAKTYGLGPGDYDRLYAAQGGVCALCRRAKGLAKKLAIDHDHKTGYVRGLLCGPCNKILGHLRDDPELALGIHRYLTSPPAFDVIGKVSAE